MKKIFAAIVLLAFLSINSLFSQVPFSFAARKADAITGSEFIKNVTNLKDFERDTLAYKEIIAGNMPGWLKKPVKITDTLKDAEGNSHEVSFFVLPDFVAIGSDTDFFRMPLLPITAQKIADYHNSILATRKISDIIHRFCDVKMKPHFMTPDSTMTTVPVFARHDSLIEAQRKEIGKPLGALIAGHKKDIVSTYRFATEPGRLFIYGWHHPDGRPQQRLTSVHWDKYVDYSHGARLVSDIVFVDGKQCSIKALLKDPVLFTLFSDEEEPMTICGYPY